MADSAEPAGVTTKPGFMRRAVRWTVWCLVLAAVGFLANELHAYYAYTASLEKLESLVGGPANKDNRPSLAAAQAEVAGFPVRSERDDGVFDTVEYRWRSAIGAYTIRLQVTKTDDARVFGVKQGPTPKSAEPPANPDPVPPPGALIGSGVGRSPRVRRPSKSSEAPEKSPAKTQKTL